MQDFIIQYLFYIYISIYIYLYIYSSFLGFVVGWSFFECV